MPTFLIKCTAFFFVLCECFTCTCTLTFDERNFERCCLFTCIIISLIDVVCICFLMPSYLFVSDDTDMFLEHGFSVGSSVIEESNVKVLLQ